MALSIQLPVTLALQVYLTSQESVMGKYKNRPLTKWTMIALGIIVSVLNVLALQQIFA